ncbi:MAG: PfkB family carbohydrate kinase [Aggregatilineales bacterium]
MTIDYLLIGHMTADLVETGRIAGGTVSYAAPVVSHFGHQLNLLTSVAVCEPLLMDLISYGDLTIRASEHTTTFENIYEPTGRRQVVHERAKTLYYEDIPAGWLNAQLLHLGPIAAESDPDIVHQFPDATILLTPQGWMREWEEDGQIYFKRWLEKDILSAVDIVVFSREDIKAAPELEAEYAASVEHLFVTRDAEGGTYYHNGQPHEYDAIPMQEVSVTGAGDVFAASLLCALPLVDHDMYKALDVARQLAALSVTRKGIHASTTSEEVEQVLESVLS